MKFAKFLKHVTFAVVMFCTSSSLFAASSMMKSTSLQEVSRIILPDSADVVQSFFFLPNPNDPQNPAIRADTGIENLSQDFTFLLFWTLPTIVDPNHLTTWTPANPNDPNNPNAPGQFNCDVTYADMAQTDWFTINFCPDLPLPCPHPCATPIMPKALYEGLRELLLLLKDAKFSVNQNYKAVYDPMNGQQIPLGPCTDGTVFFSELYPNKRFIAASAVNGTMIIDADKMAEYSGPMTYDEAVQRDIVISFIPSTWNPNHAYNHVGNYLYHIQIGFPVSNGLQIIDMTNPYQPQVVKGSNADVLPNPQNPFYFSCIYNDSYNIQGGLAVHVENDRPYAHITGVIAFDTYANRTQIPNPLFPVLSSGGVYIINASSPTAPQFVSKWLGVFIHECAILKRDGRYYSVGSAYSNNSIVVVDVTNPYTIPLYDKIANFEFPPYFVGSGQMTNQPQDILFDRCGKYAYVNSDNTGAPFYVIDIRDFKHMRILDQFVPVTGNNFQGSNLERCPQQGIDRIYTAAREFGVGLMDLSENPSKVSDYTNNGACVKSDLTNTGNGDQPIVNPEFADGFWSAQPLVKNDYSVAYLIGSGQATSTGRISEDSAVVLLKLVGTNCTSNGEERDGRADCLCLVPDTKEDAFVSNKFKLDFLSRETWNRCWSN